MEGEMAERYAKGRMLQADEARDGAVRRLVDALPDREQAFGSILLYHRIIARLDVQGAVIFEPSWLRSECFLGYPVTEEEVSAWADALVEVGLLREYQVDGIRYAWSDSFYANNPGLRLDHEDPRVPRPPGWDFEELWPRNRPGQTPEPPAWARPPGRSRAAAKPPETPPSKAPLGGVFVRGGSVAVRQAIERMEGLLGEEVAAQARRYALQFVHEDQRAEGAITAERYHAAVATVHKWKQENGYIYRGQHVPWDDTRFAQGLAHVAELVLEGRMKNHTYLMELLLDPAFPPKEGEKPANAPERREKGAATPDVAASRRAEDTRKRQEREREHAAAVRAWTERMDAWLASHPDDAERLRAAAEAVVEGVVPRHRETVFQRTVLSKLRLSAGELAGDPYPEK